MRIEPYKEGEGTTDPFSRPFIDNYVSENEAKIYLTREDIIELGFLRSNPTRNIYQHTDKPELFLELRHEKDYSVKDLVVERVIIYRSLNGFTPYAPLYNSTKPNKEDIQQVIDNYAG